MNMTTFSRNLALLLLLLLWSCTLQPHQKRSPEKQLVVNIKAILQNPVLEQCTVGVHIVRLSDNRILFSQNQNKLLHPASTMKLFTTALALESLGGQYHYTTSLAASQTNQSSLTELYLIGTGDPSLTTADLANLAKQLKTHEIQHIDTIICDASFLDDIHYGHGWMWDDQPYKDFAPISALSLNRNIVEMHISPHKKAGQPVDMTMVPQTSFVAVNNSAITSYDAESLLSVSRDMEHGQNTISISGTLGEQCEELVILRNIEKAPLYAGTVLMEECRKIGITVTNPPRIGKAPKDISIMASHQSATLASLILEMNKNSHNIYAELLLKTVAAHETSEPGTTEDGLTLLQELLQEWHIPPENYHFADGSGVSRYNLVTPKTLTTLLVHLYNNTSNPRCRLKACSNREFPTMLS